MTIEEGAIHLEVPAAQVSHTIEEGAIHVEVAAPDMSALRGLSEAMSDLATRAQPTPQVTIEPATVEVNLIDEQLRKPRVVDKQVIRDGAGRIVGVRETET